MSDKMIVHHCSPTLAGIKTGSLFVCQYKNKKKLISEICAFNKRLSSKGIVMLPIKFFEYRVLIYLYRPARLANDLNHELAIFILKSQGYDSRKTGKCLVRLIDRLREYEEFPHEIGLFLGYPAEDVYGFIKHKGCNCKCTGCWKVYGDEPHAHKCFAKYKKCTRIYSAQLANGTPIEQLTLAV